MPTIQASMSELLRTVEQLNPEELDLLLKQVSALRIRRARLANTGERRLPEEFQAGASDGSPGRLDR
jgi:hypothetical protein